MLTTDFIKAIGVEYVCIVFLIARDDQRILIEPKKSTSSETFTCFHHYCHTSKKGITQIIVERKKKDLMYLDFQVKSFANNFKHHCFFTAMTIIFSSHNRYTVTKHLNYFTKF